MSKKFIAIELDKTRNLRFGMVALSKIENKLGKPFSKIDFENNTTYDEIATVLWAGLSHEDPDLTPEKVKELVDDYSDIPSALAAMGEAMKEAFGNEKNNQVAVEIDQNGTGTLPQEMQSSVV